MVDGRIALTGVTGAIGGRVLDRLTARGRTGLRLVARDPGRVPAAPGADVRVASYDDATAMQAALSGVHTLFLVSATEAANRVRQHLTTVDAAIAAGVRRIVYLSFLAAAADATFSFARDHFRTEQHLRNADVATTFLRPSLYLDLLPGWVSADGEIRGPAGDGRVAWVARDDLADVAVEVLLGSGHDGRTYDVTGPKALSLAESADLLTSVTGRPVRYRPESLEEARASRSGAEAWEIEGWITSYAAIATGELDVVSDTVPRLAGHPARSARDFLAG